ncbi:hypothetical protein CsSME_00044930 [Camellia sinensis var. sinensis]
MRKKTRSSNNLSSFDRLPPDNFKLEKDSHLHFGEVRSNTKSHATPKSHEMFGCTIQFHSLYVTIFYQMRIQEKD